MNRPFFPPDRARALTVGARHLVGELLVLQFQRTSYDRIENCCRRQHCIVFYFVDVGVQAGSTLAIDISRTNPGHVGRPLIEVCIYIPEPSTIVLVGLCSAVAMALRCRQP